MKVYNGKEFSRFLLKSQNLTNEVVRVSGC